MRERGQEHGRQAPQIPFYLGACALPFSAELLVWAKDMDKRVFIKNASHVANLCGGLEELA